MSYIHDALKKAQKEKDSLYGEYSGIISGPGFKKHRYFIRKLSVFSFILLSLSALGLLGYHFQWNAKTERGGQVPAPAISRQTDKAVEKMDRENLGNEVEILYQNALSSHKKGSLKKAEALYNEILEKDPDHVFAVNNLGVVYLAGEKRELAKALFEKAIGLNPDYADPFYNLACFYAGAGNTGKSLEYLKKAIRLNDDVKNWARNDRDLETFRDSKDFKNLVDLPVAE
ncbi:MAG: tetratricopeptide repeat protein [Syntrophales bacterium]|nr:tetratricopeptide repeat protein [Syntrophales bacterium]MDY0045381.1 tetratricopeptide repeat protein [Syntrophales bacterium]